MQCLYYIKYNIEIWNNIYNKINNNNNIKIKNRGLKSSPYGSYDQGYYMCYNVYYNIKYNSDIIYKIKK